MSSYDNYDKIIETWVKKGETENDIFSKFICYWIAFNCWLCTQTSEINDSKALKKII